MPSGSVHRTPCSSGVYDYQVAAFAALQADVAFFNGGTIRSDQVRISEPAEHQRINIWCCQQLG